MVKPSCKCCLFEVLISLSYGNLDVTGLSSYKFKMGLARSLNLSRNATPNCLGAKVMDGQGEKSLALFPAKFQKSMWIRRGSFVVVDICGKEKALESGSKVACLVSQVLFYEQVRPLQKSPEWPEIFKSTHLEDSSGSLRGKTSQQEEDELESSDEEGLPPIEVNINRIKPFELLSDAESDSGSDRDS
ncbi:hypothetical protein I3842_04G174100 [Carya illinoinensis]|uniref:RNA-binding protein EIF1AD n=2 Tax=Carya illinoinensis TaxID=32201 RepID=A0A922FF14_CARIL|nr:hypothetical protein I3842_04G174100 [Carya illinoinensis]KAG6718849.1 hypothetical protein I3842_04G174100 [Carya illinoinensis]